MNMYNFSKRDDNFWEEYSKMKIEGGKFRVLGSQNLIHNKLIHSWKYSSHHALLDKEFFDCLKSLKINEIPPFFILDVREDHEFEIYNLPKKNKVIINNI